MILAFDIGNTSITIGAYKNNMLLFSGKMLTGRSENAESLVEKIKAVPGFSDLLSESFQGAVISSVVPEITKAFSYAVCEITGKEPVLVGEKYNGDIKVEILPISHLGADLIGVSIGAIKKYPLPCIVADLGTATKIIVIDRQGFFRGCTISPGVKISLEALSQRASLLPEISFSKPKKVIGENTVECMQSGIVFGTASMLDGLIRRMKKELDEENATVVVTGGYGKAISECCETALIYDENLLLDGLKEIYDKAKKADKG